MEGWGDAFAKHSYRADFLLRCVELRRSLERRVGKHEGEFEFTAQLGGCQGAAMKKGNAFGKLHFDLHPVERNETWPYGEDGTKLLRLLLRVRCARPTTDPETNTLGRNVDRDLRRLSPEIAEETIEKNLQRLAQAEGIAGGERDEGRLCCGRDGAPFLFLLLRRGFDNKMRNEDLRIEKHHLEREIVHLSQG